MFQTLLLHKLLPAYHTMKGATVTQNNAFYSIWVSERALSFPWFKIQYGRSSILLWPPVCLRLPIRNRGTEAGAPPLPLRPGRLPPSPARRRPRGAGRWPRCWTPALLPAPLLPQRAGLGDLQKLAESSLRRGRTRMEKNGSCRIELSWWKKSLWLSPRGNQEMATVTWSHSTAGNNVDSDVRFCFTQNKDAPYKGYCKIKHSSKVLLWQNTVDRKQWICLSTSALLLDKCKNIDNSGFNNCILAQTTEKIGYCWHTQALPVFVTVWHYDVCFRDK